MKATKTFALILSLLLSSHVFSQTNSAIEIILAEHSSTPFPQVLAHPIKVSPLIGEKLDPVERIYFNLFPKIQGFQEAVFYLNPDSSLNANVTYKLNTGINDTLILNFNYLIKLQSHILQILQKNVDQGATTTVILLLTDETELQGIIVSIDQDTITLLDLISLRTVSAGNLNSIISKNSYDNILSVLIEETGPVFVFGTGGLLIGAMGGFIIGSNIASSGDTPEDFGDALDQSASSCVGGILGSILGGAIGAGVGVAIGNNSTVTNEYEADVIYGFSELQKYTLIQGSIPETASKKK
jgi:hypothetical protein